MKASINASAPLMPDPDKLIDCAEAAAILSLAPNTVRDGKAGTERLTRVRIPNGQRCLVRLLLREVIALRATWIAAAQAPSKERALRLVEPILLARPVAF